MQNLEHSERFARIGEVLARNRTLWRTRAFYLTRLPWREQFPALHDYLLELSPAEVDALQENDEQLAESVGSLLPDVRALWALCRLPRLEQRTLNAVPDRFSRDIPGRKWQQVQAFVACASWPELPVLDWCGGKGHLGRLTCSEHGVAGTSMDCDVVMVAEGRRLSTRLHVPLQHEVADALESSGRACVEANRQALALHACGGLHLALMEAAIEKRTRALAISPCCYHLHRPDTYQPQSAQGRSTDLQLTRSELRTAVQQTATAPARTRRQRRQLQAWRLGFDLLQRELRGVDDYLAVPSVPASLTAAGFEATCRHLATLKDLALPVGIDWPAWEARGWERLHWVSAMDVVRMAFRRPLEVWLVLDRVLRLQEAGYEVELGEFCESALTPRNILIRAILP